MKLNLMLQFKKGKVYTDGVGYYRFLTLNTHYIFEKVKFHTKSNRFISTHDLFSFNANTAALLVELGEKQR